MSNQTKPQRYVVMGSQGQYSERAVWSVAVFSDESEGKRFVELLSAHSRAQNIGILAELDHDGLLMTYDHDSPPTYWLDPCPDRDGFDFAAWPTLTTADKRAKPQ